MRESRKMEHVRHALAEGQSQNHGLGDLTFVHNSLPEASLNRISLNTHIGDLFLRSPILINAMTGGSAETQQINHDLALAAKECGIPMAVGSQMAAIKNKAVRSSYEVVRKVNPEGIMIANLGSEATVEQAREAAEMIEANALQIHLNVVQELVMPEGDRDFTGMLERIERIRSEIKLPVIVKEVGFGLMKEQAVQLKQAGIQMIDVGGYGGTNFARIENKRSAAPMEWFNEWGNSTAAALIECSQVFDKMQIIASGGITNPLEIAKSLAIGASAVGLAGIVLKHWNESGTNGIIQLIQYLEQQLSFIMIALGAHTIEELWQTPFVVQGSTYHWCAQRGFDTSIYAKRGSE